MSEQSPAHHALMQYGQADEEGIIVTVSRQAIHEVSDEIDRLKAENERMRDARQKLLSAYDAYGEYDPRDGFTIDLLDAIQQTRAALTQQEGTGDE